MSRSGNVTRGGYFTMLRYLQNQSADYLERAIGYEKGRLKDGYLLVALAPDESLSSEEFELRASSRWPAGAVQNAAASSSQDIAQILSARGQDVDELKGKVAKFFKSDVKNTPAKVIPVLLGTPDSKYPPGEALGPGVACGIPQFELTIAKKFVILEDHGPNQ